MAKGFKTGGRSKGTPNKVNAALKDMILNALHSSGGQSYLEQQAEANPTAFMTLLGKVLPTTLSGDPDSPLRTHSTIEVRIVDPKN
jgi:hypothetical protein